MLVHLCMIYGCFYAITVDLGSWKQKPYDPQILNYFLFGTFMQNRNCQSLGYSLDLDCPPKVCVFQEPASCAVGGRDTLKRWGLAWGHYPGSFKQLFHHVPPSGGTCATSIAHNNQETVDGNLYNYEPNTTFLP